jgi:L-ribulose-5-phosphate 3-epimerase/hexulose-6-phosphate isomerase
VNELRLAQEHLLGVHVKDALPKVIRGVPFEEGIVPFKEIFQTLAEIGFWGMLGVEIWGDRHTGEDPITSAKEAREFVDKLIAAESWVPEKPLVLDI